MWQEAVCTWRLSWGSITLDTRANQFYLGHSCPWTLPLKALFALGWERVVSHSQNINTPRGVTLVGWLTITLLSIEGEGAQKYTPVKGSLISFRFLLYCKEMEIFLRTHSLRVTLFLTKLFWQLWKKYGTEGGAQTFWALLGGVRTQGLESQL